MISLFSCSRYRNVIGLIMLGMWLATHAFAGEVTMKIGATKDEIVVNLQGTATSDLELVAMPSWTRPETQEPLAILWKGRADQKEVRIPRHAGNRDLLYLPISARGVSDQKLLTQPQWVTGFSAYPARSFELLKTTTKKGLNCVVDTADAAALGVQHANVNINLRQLVATDLRTSEFQVTVDGQPISMEPGYVRHLDQYIGEMTAAGINVTGIILNYLPNGRTASPLIHPGTNVEAAPNHMGAFNVTSEEGLRCYRAAMQFLADRYTQPDRAHGWMPGMIVGNEVQSHWYWNNQGEVEEDEVVRDYHVALRIADIAGRSAHSAYRVYASMDHHWTRRMTGFNGKRTMQGIAFLQKLNGESKRMGDFDWAVAFHPYPENLFDPKFWADKHAPLSLNAPVVTFKNIEVLPAFLRVAAMTCDGKPRRIALTEQGFHRKVGDAGERTQAAALALGYYKISQMPEVDFFLLHRHQDHPHEGGLNLGVLDGTKRRTQAWDVYRDMDTPKWQQTAAFALELAGFKEWADVLATSNVSSVDLKATVQAEVVYDFFAHGEEAKLSDVADWRASEVSDGNDGWLPAILQHPKSGPAPARAEFSVALPSLQSGKKLVLQFSSGLKAPSVNGVGFRVNVDGESVFSCEQSSREPAAQRVDLTSCQGKQVKVEFVIDSLGNTAHDLAAWVNPRIVIE
jgi:hypothetical protein